MAKSKDMKQKLAKRLNQRLLSFEKKGLTSSREYQYLKEQIELSGAGTISNNGKLRIRENYQDIQNLFNWNKVSTAGENIKKTTRQLTDEDGKKPTREEVIEHINQNGELSKWVEENLSSVYEFSKFVGSALALEDMLHKSLRSYDYNAIWEKIRQFEQERDAWRYVHGDEKDPNNQFLKFVNGVEWQNNMSSWER